jgi:hypothetical protein
VEACVLIRRLPIGDGADPLPKRGFVYFELDGQPGEQPQSLLKRESLRWTRDIQVSHICTSFKKV